MKGVTEITDADSLMTIIAKLAENNKVIWTISNETHHNQLALLKAALSGDIYLATATISVTQDTKNITIIVKGSCDQDSAISNRLLTITSKGETVKVRFAKNITREGRLRIAGVTDEA